MRLKTIFVSIFKMQKLRHRNGKVECSRSHIYYMVKLSCEPKVIHQNTKLSLVPVTGNLSTPIFQWKALSELVQPSGYAIIDILIHSTNIY